MTFRVAISTEPDPQGRDRVDIHTHPYITAACAAGVVTRTTDRVSSRNHCNGIRRMRQLALGCESSWVKSTHDAHENTWKCGELELYFSPSAGGRLKKKKTTPPTYPEDRCPHLAPLLRSSLTWVSWVNECTVLEKGTPFRCTRRLFRSRTRKNKVDHLPYIW